MKTKHARRREEYTCMMQSYMKELEGNLSSTENFDTYSALEELLEELIDLSYDYGAYAQEEIRLEMAYVELMPKIEELLSTKFLN